MDTTYRAVIIDDEAWIREGLTEYIDWKRMDIELAGSYEDGQEALEALRHTTVDIIVTDIRMPNMTGLEFLAELRKLESERRDRKSSKVIIMSGFDDFKYAQEALKLSAFDYLLKPADVEEIEEALRRAKESIGIAEDAGSLRRSSPKVAEEGADVDSYLVKKALKLLDERFTEDLHLTTLAEELFITPNYLSRIFKSETGSSFSEFLSFKRTERACDLLRNSTLKIYQIGETVGYPNNRYFSEWFQKQTGMSPSEYRNSQS